LVRLVKEMNYYRKLYESLPDELRNKLDEALGILYEREGTLTIEEGEYYVGEYVYSHATGRMELFPAHYRYYKFMWEKNGKEEEKEISESELLASYTPETVEKVFEYLEDEIEYRKVDIMVDLAEKVEQYFRDRFPSQSVEAVIDEKTIIVYINGKERYYVECVEEVDFSSVTYRFVRTIYHFDPEEWRIYEVS